MKIKGLLFIVLTIVFCSKKAKSQDDITQNIRGQIVDAESNFPLIGATIRWLNPDTLIGTITDVNGYYLLEGIPVGRQSLVIEYLGYKTQTLSNILLKSGKELALNIQLIEDISKLKEVVISADEDVNRTNEMVTVSSNKLRVEETMKYSGTFGDVARMAQNFAGISGAGDDRNDIIVRGNSPSNVLWRLNGLDILSPNHYSSVGTTGGPISMINTNNLKNSAFLSGAFPAEYGNVVGAVFDLELRNGNPNKFEYLGQVGFNGFEIGLEGPLKIGNNSSFLFNYRYSALDLVNKLGIDFGTGFAVPRYQDLTFKFNVPTKKAGIFSLWGLGGTSTIQFLAEKGEDNLFSEGDENLKAGSNTGMIGLNHTYFFNPKFYSKLSFLVSGSVATNLREENIDTNRLDYFQPTFVSHNEQKKYTANWTMNYKINAKHRIKFGMNYDLYNFNIVDSILLITGNWFDELEFNGNSSLIRGFAQWKFRITDKFSMVSGLNYQTFTLNNSTSFEPRIGLNYELNNKITLGVAYGKHSQIQPLPIYFSKDPGATAKENKMNEELDFTKSDHYVLSFNYLPTKNLSIKVETYYQKLSSISEDSENKDFTVLNFGADFGFPNSVGLTSTGSAENCGIEFTMSRKLMKGYYILVTTSIFNSTYEGKDNVTRNTYYNSNYVLNALFGKEFNLNKKLTLTFDTRFTYSGGRRYTPILLEESISQGDEVLDEARTFEARLAPYIRPDLKIGLRYNTSKVTHTFSVDFQNIINRENEFYKEYSESQQRIKTARQRGFFPDVRYQILF